MVAFGMVDGVVAQLVERLVRNEKVAGSNPVGSTMPQQRFSDVIPATAQRRFNLTVSLPNHFCVNGSNPERRPKAQMAGAIADAGQIGPTIAW